LLRDQLLKQETSTRQNLEKVNQELKEARTIAEKAQKDAEIASEAKSLFLAKMSHEIRTPLNAVLGYSQLLKGNAMLNDQVSHGLSAIERSGQHLLKIINDILTLSKMESGHIQLQPEDFALSELIDTIQGMVAIPCQEKGLEYKIRCSEWAVDRLNGGHRMKNLRSAPPWPHLTFHSDLAKIRQVLLNLITNAVKFTSEGSVTMEIRVYHPKEAEDPFDKVPFELYFSVEDTGSGMVPEDRQRVFQAFEQGSQKGSGEHQGIGLGLAIAKRLVEVLGGNLSCDSTVGQGSLFSFTISIAPGHPEKIKDLLSLSKPRWKYAPPRALVVDDLEQNAKVLTRLLSLWGIPCEPVTSGEEAIEYLKNNRVEVVFMDIMMPKMSGTEAFKRIRQMLGPASPKCIAYSAHVLEHEQASYARSSFDGFLAKPIQMEVLVQLIYTQFSHLIWSEADSQKAAEPRLDFSSLPESSMNELRSSVKRYAVTEIMRQIDHMESEGILDEHNCRALRALVRAGDMKRVLRAFD
jgi:signal transduction histidine kinase/CheY-like chemotaxis protein